jgi:hypothetical protein
MNEVPVDIEQSSATRIGADHMGVPKFVIQSFSGHFYLLTSKLVTGYGYF